MMNAVFVLTLVIGAAAKVDFSNLDGTNKRNAVQKVVGLLNEMKAQIEEEATADAEMYDKMACWCETNTKEKTAAIAAAQSRITDLNAAVPEYAAKAAQLEVDIKQLGKDIVQKTSALEEATGIREKEHGEFQTNEKDMISSIASLKSAVGVMSKVAASGAALNQVQQNQIQGLLRHHMEHHRVLLQEALSASQHKMVLSLVQSSPATAMLQQKGMRAGQKAPSSAIFGILKGMKESFETSLSEAQEEEKVAVTQYEDLEKAKTSEVAAAKDLIETKKVELADSKEKGAQSKEDLEDTRVQLSADNKFLSDVKLKCDDADKQYQDRVKVRNEELKAVGETIVILTDDDSKDQFNKSGMGTFLQLSMRTVRKSARDRAMKRLLAASKQNPRLATIAMEMRLSGFEKVKESIDKMTVALKAEQAEEVKQKDYCTAELMENDKNVAAKSDLKTDLETTISDLSTKIEDLKDTIAALTGEVESNKKEMMRASQIREAENKEFQTCVQDQRATQAILKKAVDKLKSFYGFIQTKQEPPAQGTYAKNKGATGIITMIETLIEESKTLEAEATKGESEAQSSYESFMKDSTATIAALSKDIANKSEDMAKADMAKTTAADDLSATITDLLTLGEYAQELHKKCDFLLKNFDLRQQSRTQELEALAQAKAIFSGAK